MLKKLDLNNNPYLGVSCEANEHLLVAPTTALEKTLREAANALQTEIVRTSLGNSNLIGSLMAMNSHGAVLSNISTERERTIIEARIKTGIIRSRLNAVGNNILANDNGAIVNPDYGKKDMETIERILKVKPVRGTIAGLKTVGAAAVATNKGFLCHPHATEDEIGLLEKVLGVSGSIGTANFGTPYVGACMVANSKGAVVGFATTTIELGGIEEGLHLY